MERVTGLEPATFSLGIKITAPLVHNLQNDSRKINVHARHAVYALPDLRIAAGRFAGRFPATMTGVLITNPLAQNLGLLNIHFIECGSQASR